MASTIWNWPFHESHSTPQMKSPFQPNWSSHAPQTRSGGGGGGGGRGGGVGLVSSQLFPIWQGSARFYPFLKTPMSSQTSTLTYNILLFLSKLENLPLNILNLLICVSVYPSLLQELSTMHAGVQTRSLDWTEFNYRAIISRPRASTFFPLCVSSPTFNKL